MHDEQPRANLRFEVTPEGDLHGEDTPGAREVARRIRACVNACEGFTTEELEGGVLQEMRRVISQVVPLLQEREQLLEGQQGGAPLWNEAVVRSEN